MTTEQRQREIFDQPCAFKLVYSPENGINAHVILRGPDCWHMLYGNNVLPNLAKYHATSEDLLSWTTQEPILHSGPSGALDHYELDNGSVIEQDGKWYMLYFARPTAQASRRICLAVSDDLWHWRKIPDEHTAVFIPSSSWSGWTEDAGAQYCKDPWVIRHQDRFIMYYVCRNKHGDSCVAVASSEDLIHWQDDGPVVTTRWINDPLIGPAGFEDPRIVQRDGKFYLFASYFWGWQYAIGDDPFHFGPFRVMGPWHSSNMFRDGERWYISHVMQNVGKANVRASKREPYRGLYLAGLVWAGDYPFVTDLQDVMEGWPEERKEQG